MGIFKGIQKSITTLLLATSMLYATTLDAKPWNIKREWTQLEVTRYSKWIGNIYNETKKKQPKLKNSNLYTILRNPNMNKFLKKGYDDNQNPNLKKRDFALMKRMTHCGSFPKLLFMYYSYKRGLPCTSSHVRGRGGDIRYSRNNHAANVIDNLSYKGNAIQFIKEAILPLQNEKKHNNFVTGNFRTSPEKEKTDSVPISMDYIKAGSILYNDNGHALVVGKVTDLGEVYFIDGHPSTFVNYSKNISVVRNVTSIKKKSNCYGGFRGLRLAKPKRDKLGRVTGVVPMTNKEMIKFGYSTEQYIAMKNIKNKTAKVNNQKVSSFQEYIIKRIKSSDVKENPFKFIRESAVRLDGMFESRRDFVSSAWENVLKNGSIKFPNDKKNSNIYQAHGRWETWSSPSSDVDRKCSVLYIGKRLEGMINSYIADSKSLDLEKNNITSPKELCDAIYYTYVNEFNNQDIKFTSSKEKEITMTLLEITCNLWDLSFDPNHAPEIRWGFSPEKLLKQEAIYKKNSEKIASFSDNLNLPRGYMDIATIFSNGKKLNAMESYNAEKGIRLYLQRQDKPTSIRPKDNPSKPLELLPHEILHKYNKKFDNEIVLNDYEDKAQEVYINSENKDNKTNTSHSSNSSSTTILDDLTDKEYLELETHFENFINKGFSDNNDIKEFYQEVIDLFNFDGITSTSKIYEKIKTFNT